MHIFLLYTQRKVGLLREDKLVDSLAAEVQRLNPDLVVMGSESLGALANNTAGTQATGGGFASVTSTSLSLARMALQVNRQQLYIYMYICIS